MKCFWNLLWSSQYLFCTVRKPKKESNSVYSKPFVVGQYSETMLVALRDCINDTLVSEFNNTGGIIDDQICNLRAVTGAGVFACKKALEEQGSFNKAKEWLLKQPISRRI